MQEKPLVQRDVVQNDTLTRLGLDPSQPFHALNLAGIQGVPSPQALTHVDTAQPSLILPDFGTQSYDVPTMKPYDLTSPGITYIPEFATDPALPDLDDYNHPYGLDLSTQGMSPDLQLAHAVPSPSDIASSLYPGLGFLTLDVQQNGTDVDPALPDLQHPILTQQIHMPSDERPGSLDPNALDVLHASLSYQEASDMDYPGVWMDQRGMNTARTRHMSLLLDGLDA
ncbi:MAG: hypothetical protein NVSMB49_26240 [Ktedonobacteraceae bacterium]